MSHPVGAQALLALRRCEMVCAWAHRVVYTTAQHWALLNPESSCQTIVHAAQRNKQFAAAIPIQDVEAIK